MQQIRGARGFRRARRSRRSRPAGESTNQTPSSSRSLSTNSLVTTAPPAGIGLNPQNSRLGLVLRQAQIYGYLRHYHGTNVSGERQRSGTLVAWSTSGAGPRAKPKAPAVGHFLAPDSFLARGIPRAPRLKAVFLRGVPPRAPRLKAPLLLVVWGLPHGVVAPRQEPKSLAATLAFSDLTEHWQRSFQWPFPQRLPHQFRHELSCRLAFPLGQFLRCREHIVINIKSGSHQPFSPDQGR